MKPAATLRFFRSDSSTALSMRRTPGGSTANDFSMNTFDPFLHGILEVQGAEGGRVVSITTSPGPRQSMAFL